MNWKPISEKPKKDGWYLVWKPDFALDDWDIDNFVDGRFIDGNGVTHWAEVTGPEQKEKSNEVD